MEKKLFTTPSGTVRYWTSEEPVASLPWMVLVPGLTADHSLFGPQLAFFEGRANLLTWDAPAHAASRPYPLDFSMDDYARILHGIMAAEGIERAVWVGQSLGGYVGQAFASLFPGELAGFVSIDSAPLQRSYYQAWEIAALERTFAMYASIPWKLLLAWGSMGVATTEAGRANMRAMMEQYGKLEYCRLAAHGYRMLAQAVRADRAYELGCPALLLCGERDMAGSTKRYNKMWHARTGLPLEWIPNAGHNSTIDAPEFVNACLETFLATLTR